MVKVPASSECAVWDALLENQYYGYTVFERKRPRLA